MSSIRLNQSDAIGHDRMIDDRGCSQCHIDLHEQMHDVTEQTMEIISDILIR